MTQAQLRKKKAELGALSATVRAHKANLARRDELVRELAGSVSRGELADLAGLTPGRISQITETATEE